MLILLGMLFKFNELDGQVGKVIIAPGLSLRPGTRTPPGGRVSTTRLYRILTVLTILTIVEMEVRPNPRLLFVDKHCSIGFLFSPFLSP